jgi:hypothetical protein
MKPLTKYIDTLDGKAYLYTLIASPDGLSFNLLGENGRLLFFHHTSPTHMMEYLKNLKELSIP